MYNKVISSEEAMTPWRKLTAALVSLLATFFLYCAFDGGHNVTDVEHPVDDPETPETPVFVTDNVALEKIRSEFVVATSLATVLPKLLSTWDYAVANYFKTYTINTKLCTFVADPSQGGDMVSEGLGFWRRIAPLLARLDPARAAQYQTYFDQLGNAFREVRQLAKAQGSPGEMAAWAFEVVVGVPQLDTSKSGAENSAADADFDDVEGLLNAQENVGSGLFVDRGYAAELEGYAPKTKVLFELVNGVFTMKPSEDWNTYKFSDYTRAATALRLSRYYTAHGNAGEAAFWYEVARGLYLEGFETIADTGVSPATINIAPGNAYPNDLDVTERTPPSWDGPTRFSRNWAEILLYFEPNAGQKTKTLEYVKTWGGNYTEPHFDALNYLPLALVTGDITEAQNIWLVAEQAIGAITVYDDPIRYFQMSISMLDLIFILSPYPTGQKIQMEEQDYAFSRSINGKDYVVKRSVLSEPSKPAEYQDRWKLRQ
jgi:hypothetical protein